MRLAQLILLIAVACACTRGSWAGTDPAELYKRARELAIEGKLAEAADQLIQAVEAGFNDFTRLADDPAMEPIRTPENLERVKAAIDRARHERDMQARRSRDAWKEKFGETRYRYEEDAERRLLYATSLAPRQHREARDMLNTLADHLAATLFDAPPAYDVFIAIATRADARDMFERETVGGRYEHSPRRLVTRDAGSSLRHEFVHVMHFGHMERLGQQHRLWVQEGLGALYEDYRLIPDGIAFLPNERTNIMRNRLRANRVMPWAELFDLPAQRFMAQSGALYPQVRSIFTFIAAEGKLTAWYKAYVEHFDADPSGRTAFETVFGQSLGEIEQRWREWAQRQSTAGD
ncbi:MAG TPA: hypothetical protein PK098_08670 [Phycisphaerales bacterium]|nr:hypothetical protein [Phycisphaerales bacterium]